MATHLMQVIAATKGKNRKGRQVHHFVWGTRPYGSIYGNLLKHKRKEQKMQTNP